MFWKDFSARADVELRAVAPLRVLANPESFRVPGVTGSAAFGSLGQHRRTGLGGWASISRHFARTGYYSSVVHHVPNPGLAILVSPLREGLD